MLYLAAFFHATPHGVGNHAYSLTHSLCPCLRVLTSSHPSTNLHTHTPTHPRIHTSGQRPSRPRRDRQAGRRGTPPRPRQSHSRGGQAVFYFHRNAWVEPCHADGLDDPLEHRTLVLASLQTYFTLKSGLAPPVGRHAACDAGWTGM